VARADANHRGAGVSAHRPADKFVSDTARLSILFAGVAACFAAAISLIRLRAREIQYSEAIAFVCEGAGIPDPLPHELRRKPAAHRPGRVDRRIRRLGEWRRLPTVNLFWLVALALFIVADLVAYCATT
jgi:hypothetical protein